MQVKVQKFQPITRNELSSHKVIIIEPTACQNADINIELEIWYITSSGAEVKCRIL